MKSYKVTITEKLQIGFVNKTRHPNLETVASVIA